jgi:tetratricopeptide (TPR) repeat protein
VKVTFGELQKQLNLDVKNDIDRTAVFRAGFQHSKVSNSNRLIERHTISTGYFWTSYDFARDDIKEKNLFDSPLGPGGTQGFQPDGGETIFSLPNGFQAYFLNKGTGEGLSQVENTGIVKDLSREDSRVTNGISCMGCHVRGMRDDFVDEVRARIRNNKGSFRPDVVRLVEALHPPANEMAEILRKDLERFKKAEEAAGISLKGPEPVTFLATRYSNPVKNTDAQAELGITATEFEESRNSANGEVLRLAKQLMQGSLKRKEFETRYSVLINGLLAPEETFEPPPSEFIRKGNLLLDSDPTRALVEYASALDVSPNHPDALVGKGRALNRQGKYKESFLECDSALRVNPQNALALNCRGFDYKKMGKNDLALADWNSATQLDSKFVLPFSNRGNLFLEQNKLDDAVKQFTTAIEIDPTDAYFWSRRGESHFKNKEYGPALADLNQAIKLGGSGLVDYFRLRGNVYGFRPNPDLNSAVNDYAEVLRLDPGQSSVRVARIQLLARLSRNKEAIAEATEGIRRDASAKDFWVERSKIYMSEKMFDQAISDMDHAVGLEPSDGYLYYVRGAAISGKCGCEGGPRASATEWEKAVSDFGIAIRLGIKTADIFERRGKAQEQLSNFGAAANDYRAALSIDPSLQFSRARLNDLTSRRPY